ncbi:hypothetical protein [Bryobacter aggregatus]|uniref:hypothetical protein n=1 Tax=Bryobacter aggregatus TaxID=360054 RepID=UPI0004E1102C|nr:hypothetical protein [Bryobacter aggregatus]
METESVHAVLVRLVRHPWREIVLRWNWKSAVTSALIRAVIFFVANLSAGRAAAVGAMEAEFLWRFAVAGFVGSIIQSLRRAEPLWQATLITAVVLPLLNHSIEFLVHYTRGTPKLMTSILASVCFTVIAMLFNAYAMRRGAMIIGKEGRPLWRDLLDMPRLIWGFLLWILRIQRSSQSL